MAVAEGANGRVASPAPAAGSGAGSDRGTSDGGSSAAAAADRQAELEVMSPRRGFQEGGGPVLRQHRDQDLKPQQQQMPLAAADIHVSEAHGGGGDASSEEEAVPPQQNGAANGDCAVEGFKKEMRDLEDLFSKLNPMAEEFVPPQYAKRNESAFAGGFGPGNGGFQHGDPVAAGGMFRQHQVGKVNGGGRGNGLHLDLNGVRRRGNGYGTPGKRSSNPRTSMAQREEAIKRTVYVSDIDRQVTEEQLAALFIHCGQVVDCRICGDPNSILRFAFIEFTDEEGARAALSLAGTMLGYYPVRVLPSKTAIAPVNPTFLPRSEDEREMCARTVYCTNIDKRVSQAEVKLFFEALCGEVHRLRLLGDFHHHTRIAFVEFVSAESAIAALSCSGAVLRSLPVRVSPSKTPVRPRSSHSPMH